MSDIVIRAEKLSKLYTIGERQKNLTLREVIASAASAPARLFRARKPQSGNGDATHIWALKDVSFEVRRGEVVGIIGRNGAGKSTLLKILARVTKPTTGCAEVRGRMGSLLEVGTGFHGELTGRENTFLNGAILGMKKAEIDRKFDEIVAFAEIEKFIDTPVKHYSTGMYLRLAFAVAAHLETEIILIDEILAVGDVEFQKKCLGRVGDVSRQGRTVIFVSHNMGAVLGLCERGILLDLGRIKRVGNISEVVTKYLQLHPEQEEVVWLNAPRASLLRGGARLLSAKLSSPAKVGHWRLPFGVVIRLTVGFELKCRLDGFEMGVSTFTPLGFEISSSLSFHDIGYLTLPPGRYAFDVELPDLALTPGTYNLSFGLRSQRGMEDLLPEALSLEVTTSDKSAALNVHSIRAAVVPKARFQLQRLDKDDPAVPALT
jgi:lipopolysaccharide transport system ATP-binding protein